MKLYTLYAKPLTNPEVFEARIKELPKARAQKARSYRLLKDQALSLGAGLLLNQAFRERGIDPMAAVLNDTKGKKPELTGLFDFHFNLSHSEDFTILGVGDKPIGVDIEKISPITLDIAKQYFFKGEYAYLNALPKDERTLGFFRLWTLKESFMKAVGLGFKLPLNAFEICLSEPIQVNQTVDAHHYVFTEYHSLPGYCISICEQL